MAVPLPCDVDCPPPPTPQYTLHITVTGYGSVSDGQTTLCTQNTSCTLHYDAGTDLTLVGNPVSGETFTGWSGDCSGTGNCAVTMTQDHTVAASFADLTPPAAPTIGSPTDGQVIQSANDGSTSVSFTDSDSDATHFLCRMDVNSSSGAPLCTSGWATGALSTGTHTAYVWATDLSDNISSPASRSFKVVNLPDTTIGGTPAAGSLAGSTATAFSYTSPTGTSYECTLDGTNIPCSPNLGPVGEGGHSLSVRAGISPFGDNVVYFDPTPATRSWTVDSVAPTASISSGRAQGESTTASDADFHFTTVDPAPGTALTIECSLDDAAFGPCPGPAADEAAYAGLPVGQHTFRVRATDAAGNVSAVASRAWTVASASSGTPDTSGSGGSNPAPTGSDGTAPAPTGTTPGTADAGGATPPPAAGGTTSTPTPAALKCVVPKLIGLSLAQAKKALAKAHCGVGRIAKKAAKAKKGGKKPKRGTVIAQSPAAGTKKPAGSKVALTLAK
ncbi:MAG: large repetitive protein [Thermoleophilaceae bacterium]|nr:large repetitive protein [Thermoleophilaceae bacterium]